VCCDNFLLYRAPGHEELRAVIPRRADLPGDRGVLITAFATLRQKSRFYTFVQSEYGDLYRVALRHEGEAVSELTVKYFDSIPPASALCILRRGFLFAASEAGDHALYQFQGLGDDDAVESSSATLQRVGAAELRAAAGGAPGEEGNDEDDEDEEEGYLPVFFEPRFPQVNLEVVDRVESLCPILDMKVANLLREEVPQIFAACGRGPRSTLRVLRPGLAVTELAVSPLPGAATGVWTARRAAADPHHALIVVSFREASLVLGVGETVEQVTDSGLASNAATLRVQLLADDSLLQVTPAGLRHVRPDRRVNEWRAPGKRRVVRAASNERQVALALEGGEILYFELSPQGMLVETEKKETGCAVAALDLGPLPEGRQRSRFLAVGAYDKTVRLLSLDPGDSLRALATQAVGADPESVLLLDSPAAGRGGGAGDEGAGAGALFLQVGLGNGVLLRSEVDRVTGALADARTRFLGVRAPRLVGVAVRGEPAMLALSSRPWLGYSDQVGGPLKTSKPAETSQLFAVALPSGAWRRWCGCGSGRGGPLVRV
jgi:splicing factor 3B subunit 3